MHWIDQLVIRSTGCDWNALEVESQEAEALASTDVYDLAEAVSLLPVGESLDVAKDHRLPVCGRQSRDGRLQAGAVGVGEQRRFWRLMIGIPGSALAVRTLSRSSTTTTADERCLRSHV
jgi:hypothetical protein